MFKAHDAQHFLPRTQLMIHAYFSIFYNGQKSAMLLNSACDTWADYQDSLMESNKVKNKVKNIHYITTAAVLIS